MEEQEEDVKTNWQDFYNLNHLGCQYHVCDGPPPAGEPCVALTKSCDAGPYRVGDTVTFTMLIENCGIFDLADVVIVDETATVVGELIPLLTAGETDDTSISATYTITPDDLAAGTVENTATVMGTVVDEENEGEPVILVADSTHSFTVEPTPGTAEIKLTKTCEAGPYYKGDTVTFIMTIENCGDFDLTNVNVTPADAAVTINGGPIDLAAGATDATTITGTYVVTEADETAGTVDCMSTVEGTATVDGTDQTVTGDSTHSFTVEIKPCKSCFTSVEIAEETLTGTSGSDKTGFSARLVESKLYGSFVKGYDGIQEPTLAQSDFPMDIPIPAHTAGCVLALHIEWGCERDDSPQDGLQDPTLTQATAGDVSQHVLVCDQRYSETQVDGPSNGQLVYFMDGITGNGGDTVTLDFGVNQLNDRDGAMLVHWVEICSDDGSDCVVSDFNVGGIQTAFTPEVTTTDPYDATTALDFGDCPAVLFGGARHAQFAEPVDWSVYGLNIPYTGDWFNLPGATELYDFVSFANPQCQIGSSAAFVPGGAGALTYSFQSNQPTNLADSVICGVPVNCAATGGVLCTTAEILDNVNCNDDCDTTLVCRMQASLTFTIAPGETACVIPAFDAVEQSAAKVAQTNTGTDPLVVTLPLDAVLEDSTVTYAPGEGKAVQGKLNVYLESENSNVVVSDTVYSCDMVPA